MIQSPPAGTFSIRSPKPVAVSRAGAPAMMSRSAITAAGAGQLRVCLKPSLLIDEPNEA